MTTTSLAIASRSGANAGVALGGTGLRFGDTWTDALGDADSLGDAVWGGEDALSLGDGNAVTTELPSTLATKTLDDEVPFSRPTTTTCRALGEEKMLFAATGTVTTVALLSIGAQSVEPAGQTETTGGDVTIRVDADSSSGDSAHLTGPTSLTLIGVGPGVAAATAVVGTRLGITAI